ncbi:MAG: CHAT domain-containing protein [Acidobacteria bacterium]|nr:CHAT domain-containing protein [Acidobacteriota bacterium]
MTQSHPPSCLWKSKWLSSRGLSFLSGISILLTLQACRPTEGTIRRGESVVITLALEKGQFQAIMLEQRDSNLMMTLTSPTNKRLRVDYFDGPVGEEKLFWKAEETGAYKLAVSLTSKESLTGRYKLTVQPPRTPTAQDDDRWEAQRLYAEASHTQNLDLIVKTYDDAAGKWRTAGEPSLSAITLISLGKVCYDHKKFAVAETYYQQALREAQFASDLRGQADAIANLGLVSDRLSRTWEDKQQSRQLFDQALGLSRQSKDERVEASTLNNLGRYYRSIGQYQSAEEHYQQALVKMKALGDREREGVVLANLGAAYRSLGLKAEAEKAYNDALDLQRKLGDVAEQARSQNGLGRVLDLLGERTIEEKEKARQKFEEAVNLGNESNDRDFFEHNLGTICYELGMIYNRLGESDKARDLFNQALTHLQAAFKLRREGETIHHTLTSLGLLAQARGQKQEARGYLEEALTISRKIKDDYQEAIVLAAHARCARDDNRLLEAKTRIEEALRIVESVAVRITSLDLRSSYTMAQRHFYDLHADILLRLRTQKPRKQPFANYHKVAWGQIERARMTALRESVDSLDLLPSQGVAQADVANLRKLRSELLFVRTMPDSPEKLDQISKLTTVLQELEAQIAQKIPRAANQVDPPVTTDRLREIQAALTKDTLLLEYALGEDHCYLWLITPTTFEVFALPGQARLEGLARQVRDSIASPQEIKAETRAASVKMSNWLLGPVASRLGTKKLLIVADGILDRIPFGALPTPAASTAATQPDSHLLIEAHEIVYAPAAMTLLSPHGPRVESQAPASSIVAIADPVFNAQHPQATHCKEGQPRAASAVAYTSLTDQMAEELSPVPFGESERSAFREAVFGPLSSSPRHELFGFQAKRSNVLTDKLATFRDVIFYTHCVFNERDQEMTGLALSRLNRECDVDKNFLLNLNDIYNLKLSADLVTLIACDTARNQTMRGFGLGSIARGFMYAGATRVMGTLWKVNAQSSLELATRFYRNRRAGQTAPQALRNAQLSFLNGNKSDWRLPYYWAGFVLMGEIN